MRINNLKRDINFRVRKFNRRIYIFNEENAYEINDIGLEIYKNIGKIKTIDELFDIIDIDKTKETEEKIIEYVKYLKKENIIYEIH